MSITISSAPSVSESSIKDLSKREQRIQTKEARKEARASRRAEREERRESRRAKNGDSIEIPSTPSSTDLSSLPSTPGIPAIPTSPEAVVSFPQTLNIEIPTANKTKSFSYSDLKGERIVNFAVQGKADGGSNFSVFASGKGPGAIDTEKQKESSEPASQATSDTASTASSSTIDTQA